MDEPVTDIVFVSSKDNCPEGYRIIETCPCGHEAQMWEKVLGGESGERYLCFTKEDKDDMVIEDMYVPGKKAQYLYKGYSIITKTVEGDDPLYHKQLAVKKVPRTHAGKVVADIIICRSRDNVSKMYKKLDKINGLCICFRQADMGGRNTPSPKPARRATTTSIPPSASSVRSQRGGSLKINELSQHMAGVTLSGSGPSYRRTSSPSFHRTVSPLAKQTHLSHSPSPPPNQSSPSPPNVMGEAASVQHTLPLETVPPPTLTPPSESTDSNNLQPSSETPSNYPPANPSYSTHYPPQSSNYPPPTAYHPTGMQPPPPPQSSTSTPYPPAPSMGYYSNPTAPPPPSGGPSQALGFGGLMSGSRPPSGYPPYQPPAGYSPAPPTLADYYSAVAGPSFSGAPVHFPPRGTSGPAPYNPYQQAPPTSYQQAPPTSYPPPPTSGQSNYGFKF